MLFIPLTARQEVHAVKRIKLEYNEIVTCEKEMLDFWERQTIHSLAKVDQDMLKSYCKQGILYNLSCYIFVY